MEITVSQLNSVISAGKAIVTTRHNLQTEFYRVRAIFYLANSYDNASTLAATAIAAQYLPCIRMIANLETEWILGLDSHPSAETFV